MFILLYRVLEVLDDDVSNHPPALFPDSQSSVYDSMATADESSFIPFQDESCMSFRKTQEVNPSKSLLANAGGRENSMGASRSCRGNSASSVARSKLNGGGVIQQPALSERK